ncbi:enoyl-CoA hydratase-related protein [Ruegeria sp. WL0004]|uniref:Enoyl-CoA hydratase-related protein n=1 Tax=Ruegeria marisflavi TaxID=2984152 RepID=A0ABT2WMH5_9RHOB|nr:enoyl-CoA hydratase-related protein [Ruegeria sp. WL0004]MCU9837086.1 enoyl-CoA hydratase-related protein [Ruegeria sp. WL0004]
MTRRKIETGSTLVQCEVSNHVATITLNNPEKRNAMSGNMTDALSELFLVLDLDSEVRVLILTGAAGAFCAGGDVASMGGALAGGAAPDTDAMIRRLRHAQETVGLRLYNLGKPTIAALPGAAAGAGMSLALACDLRVMADSAFLLPAFGGIGLSGDFGGTWLLNQLVGPSRAKEIYFTNRRIGAEDALSLGLANRVVAAAELQQTAETLAAEIAGFAPMALRYMKENHNRARATNLQTSMEIEADRMIRTLQSKDHAEGARAFMEKRKPVFTGR